MRVLRHPAFLAGETDTGFLDRHPELLAPLAGPADAAARGLAAALAARRAGRAGAPVQRGLPVGLAQRRPAAAPVAYEATGTVEVGYRLDRDGAASASTERAGASTAGATAPDEVVLDGDGVRRDVSGVQRGTAETVRCGLPAGPVALPS